MMVYFISMPGSAGEMVTVLTRAVGKTKVVDLVRTDCEGVAGSQRVGGKYANIQAGLSPFAGQICQGSCPHGCSQNLHGIATRYF
jgi:hypothetical protein